MGEYSCAGKIRCSDNTQRPEIKSNFKSESQILEDHKKMIEESNARHALRMAEIKAADERWQAKLNGCSTMSKTPKTVSDAVRVGIESRYKEQLKDPYSAHFRKIQEASAWDQCIGLEKYIGEVNAKNSYGGYTGYQSFRIN
jgi:hypothetical protein